MMTREEMIDEIETYLDEYEDQYEDFEDILLLYNAEFLSEDPSGEGWFRTMSDEDLENALNEIRSIAGSSISDIKGFVSDKLEESSLNEKDRKAITNLVSYLLEETDYTAKEILNIMDLSNEDIREFN